MSAQKELFIVIDEQDPAFTYQGSWTKSNGPWYLDTCVYGDGNITLSFNGSSVAFIGNSPERNESSAPSNHNVTIDGGPAYVNTFPLPVPSDPKIQQGYSTWYTSPALNKTTSHSTHNITISQSNHVAVDFAIVTLDDPDTPISDGHRVLVDDQDPAVHYTGSWKNTTDSRYLSFTNTPGGYPVMNSTHQSQAAGDCLEFRFSGTAIDVYGVWFPPSRDTAKISTRATLDGAIIRRDPVIGRQGERYQNLLLFSATDLLPTEHTLTITVDGTSQLFILDYMVYDPSFSSLRDMPDLSKGYRGCTTADDGSSIPVGAIVGVVLGLFAFGLLTIIGVWRWNRRRNQRTRNPSEIQLNKPPSPSP